MNVKPVFIEQHQIHIHDWRELARGRAGAGGLARGGAGDGRAQVRTGFEVGGHQVWAV